MLICIKCEIPILKRTANGRRLCDSHIKEAGKIYRKKYKDTIKKSLESWRKRNPEYMKEWFKSRPNFYQDYRLKNLEKIRQKEKKYSKLNPDKINRRRRIQSLRYRKAGLISKELRKIIFERYDNKCNICKYDKFLSIDHIVPVSKKGITKESNLQILCNLCNSKKSDIILTDSMIIKIKNYSNLCRQNV